MCSEIKLSVLPVSMRAYVCLLFILTDTITFERLEKEAEASTANWVFWSLIAADNDFFDKHTLAKCPFLLHFLHIASFAGQADLG